MCNAQMWVPQVSPTAQRHVYMLYLTKNSIYENVVEGFEYNDVVHMQRMPETYKNSTALLSF